MSMWACALCKQFKSDPGDEYCGWCQESLDQWDTEVKA